MGKKHILYIIYSFLLAVTIVGGLFLISLKKHTSSNNFSRKFNSNLLFINNRKSLQLKDAFYYIAGATEEKIFLGSYARPEEVLVTNYDLNSQEYINLNVPDTIRIAWKVLKTFMNYPDVFLIEGATPTVLHSTYPDLIYTKRHLEKQQFHHILPISKNSVVARIYDSHLKSLALIKNTLDTIPGISAKYPLGEPNKSIFLSDGMLRYDPIFKKIVYVHFYSNEFICFDTDLNYLYNGNTIDTISQPQIKVDTIYSENKATLASPPRIVNKRSSFFNGQLFIHSKLKADNEEERVFKRNNVIDVYELTDKKSRYHFSFYLPPYKKEKIRELKTANSHIITLQDDYIILDPITNELN